MKNLLQQIYTIQKIDLQLDEFEELKGDLPKEAARLRNEVQLREKSLEDLRHQITKSVVERDETDVEIQSTKEKLEKYRKQQLEVKTNKQYDSLTKEIDAAQLEIANLERRFSESEKRIHIAKIDKERIEAELPALVKEQKQIEKELSEYSTGNEEEEKLLREQRAAIVADVSADFIQTYERIRGAKGGKAIVPIVVKEGKKKVKEGTCGGCFNRLPPERLVELRTLDKMFRCENCGRILVPNEVVSIVEQNLPIQL
jgi:predicted  nucleic acid-binding Zn-ribbon protein